MRALTKVLFASLATTGAPALAEVTASSDSGFVVERSVVVPVSAVASWRVLLQPGTWWQNAHTWSGNAANMSIEARAGGCFCEVLPRTKGASPATRGVAEHMRVIHAAPQRMLRMSGALGPLQAEAAQGTMTITLTPVAGGAVGTTIRMVYVVGGYMRLKPQQIAPAVDGVLGAQLAGLAARLGVPRSIPVPAPVPPPAAAKP